MQKKPFYKRKRIILAFVAATFILLHLLSPILIIFPLKLSFDSSEYVRVRAFLINASISPKFVYWNSCGEHYSLHIDGEQIYPEKARNVVMCLIGPNHMPPFAVFGNKEYHLNPTDLAEGFRSFHSISNDKRSNSIFFYVRKNDTIVDCYNYTQNPTPLCRQLLIHTNVISANDVENNERCGKIKKTLIDGTPLRPIETLSTTNCDTGDSAYFVMNVPEEDFKSWQATIAEQQDLDIFSAWTEYR